MQRKILWQLGFLFELFMLGGSSPPVSAANVMNYGADGNDYFQFTTPSMSVDKASGFTTLITFAMHVDADGTLEIGGVACTNGVYVGPTNWGSLIATLKSPPTTVTRYEVCIGGYTDTSYNDIKSVIASQGTGPGSILYRNFQALKAAVPGIDAINDDDEETYDLASSTSFANMLGGLGYKFTTVPYQNQSFWVNLNNDITNCDYIYLQCYEGGAGNDPGQWNTAFGNGVKVIPGQESNTANPATWRSWYLETGTQGGFYYPDVIFNTTYWSALVYQANGAVPGIPTGLKAVAGGQEVNLAWNTLPGAISYNIKRSTVSGGETNLVNISTANNNWPDSNQYTDTGLATNITYYYEISGVNTNGESSNSSEVSAVALPASVFNFEIPSIGAGNYQYNPAGGPWTFNGASPSGSGLVANGSGFGNPNAPGTNQQAGFVQEDGTVSRSIAGFIPGTNYTVTFSAAQRPPGQNAPAGGSESWNVEIDNAVIGSYNPGNTATSYVDYTTNFTATNVTHTLSFVGTDLAGGNNTVFIDNLRISPPLLPVPVVTMNTVPVTAVDVVGNQLTFTAAFTGASPLAYQWQKIGAGVTNNISGATNTTLTMTNLQLPDTASYQLQATNVYGVAVSAPSVLTVRSVPAAVNNIIASDAAQTGLGAALTNFVPSWTVGPGSLIAGQLPSSVGSGNFTDGVGLLTDGSFGWLNYWPGVGISPTEVTCGTVASSAGQSVTYTLTGAANGYNLTNITVYGGWGDSGRDQQAYTVYYATLAAPTAFVSLSAVNYLPSNPAAVQCATRVTLSPATGVLASNVAAVKIDFTTPAGENGYEGYSEIQVFGLPSVISPATNPTNILFQVAGNSLTLNWPSDHIGWRLQVQTNDLSVGLGTNWFDVAGSILTNQMTIPVNSTNGSIFYRLAYP